MPLTNSGSGVTHYVLNNLRFIDQERFCFDVATRSKSLDFEDVIRAAGGKVHFLSCNYQENEKQFIKEMNTVLDEGYDAVHLHTSYWKGFQIEEMAMARKVPEIIVHAHNTMVDISDPEKRADAVRTHNQLKSKFSEKLATRFCACSRQAAEWLFGGQVVPDKIIILKNAVDVDAFTYNTVTRDKIRKELGLDGCLVLGNVGRFSYQKNHALLMEVFEKIVRVRNDARLLLIGDGPLEEDIRQVATKKGIIDKTLFLGRFDNVAASMQAMDMYLHPALFEGLGFVLVEAQTSGLWCLAGDAVPSEVKFTPNLEFLPYDADSWVRAILERGDKYERLDCSGRAAEAGFSLREQSKVLEKLYTGQCVS